MNKAEHYRRLADECLRLARSLFRADQRAEAMRMAETWLRLAEQQETTEPPTGNEKPEDGKE